MNETTIYRDDFAQTFGHESAFLGFLRERESNSRWNKDPSNTLRFEALEADTTVTQLLLYNYAMGGREGILMAVSTAARVRHNPIEKVTMGMAAELAFAERHGIAIFVHPASGKYHPARRIPGIGEDADWRAWGL